MLWFCTLHDRLYSLHIIMLSCKLKQVIIILYTVYCFFTFSLSVEVTNGQPSNGETVTYWIRQVRINWHVRQVRMFVTHRVSCDWWKKSECVTGQREMKSGELLRSGPGWRGEESFPVNLRLNCGPWPPCCSRSNWGAGCGLGAVFRFCCEFGEIWVDACLCGEQVGR